MHVFARVNTETPKRVQDLSEEQKASKKLKQRVQELENVLADREVLCCLSA